MELKPAFVHQGNVHHQQQSQGQPFIMRDADLSDYLPDQAHADVFAAVNWNRDDLTALRMHHTRMTTSGDGAIVAQLTQLPHNFT
jgi:hypothetical protein